MQLKDIEDIHKKKKAIFNKLYIEDSGKIYIGTIDNRLKLLTSTSEVVINNTTTLQDILVTIGDGTKFLSDDGTYKISSGVSDAEKTTWNNKQEALVSGTNIKTVNSNSLLGSGNLVISEGLNQQQIEGLI